MSEKKGGFAGMLKLGVVLALYAVAACVGLAFVYAGTEKVIAQRQRADLEASLSELFSEADDFKAISGLKSGDPTVTIEEDGAFAAYKNGEVIGAVLRTSRASYNGAIKILVGVGTNGKIRAVKILEHSDTPGLGANAASSTYYVDRAKGIHFYDQFAGKAVSDPFVPKSDVIAITAATITSRAVAASVKAAGEAALAWFAGGRR
jgi:Na+-translocating ferredoxin:NAD+ oxidoreductase subunit G